MASALQDSYFKLELPVTEAVKVWPHLDEPRAHGNGGRFRVAFYSSKGHTREREAVDHVPKPNQEMHRTKKCGRNRIVC